MKQELQSSLLHRARLKNLLNKALLLLLAVALVYGGVAMIYASKTIYKIRKNYAAILETLSGKRIAITEVGWHVRLPLFTRLELEVPLMNQEMHLGNSSEPQRIMSKGNVALWTSAMLTFRIRDLDRWGIENRSPQTLLQAEFDGIVKDVMQSESINELISDRVRIKEQIYRALKDRPINEGGLTLGQKYGIEIISFILRDTRYGEKLAEASEEKKRRELIAEAENYAADQEASQTRKLYAAYTESIQQMRQALGISSSNEPHLLNFLNQQRWASAYQKNQQGQNTFVLNNTASTVPVTLPSPVGIQHQAPVKRDATNEKN